MSWQSYHESIMTMIDKSGITSVGTALGSVLSSVTSASGTDRLGLVTSVFAALNGVTTITSVISGTYGDYEKEGRVARTCYTFDAYTAISFALMTFLLVGEMHWLEAVSYGILPLVFCTIDFLTRSNLKSYPERSKYLLLWARITPIALWYGSVLTGRHVLAERILQVVGLLRILNALRYILAPESKLASYKYTWDAKSERWVHFQSSDIEHKGEHQYILYIKCNVCMRRAVL